MDGWMDVLVDGWMDGWTNGQTDGWMDRGWMDGQTDVLSQYISVITQPISKLSYQ